MPPSPSVVVDPLYVLRGFPVGRLPRSSPGLRWAAGVEPFVFAAIEPTSSEDRWVLALVPIGAWAILDAVRWAGRRASRSAVAEDALRRALAVDAEAAA